jgi:choline dehydrogenase-like flavoprotein
VYQAGWGVGGAALHYFANFPRLMPNVFPTSGAPNPTYTILALSLRGAENLAQNWGSIAG